MHHPIFVYGTLQRGQERAVCWPYAPSDVSPAETPGRLFDLGPYPGMTAGSDIVCGELWSFLPDEMPVTLQVLDRIEGFQQRGQTDWYRRRLIACRKFVDSSTESVEVIAHTYLFARPEELEQARRIAPDAGGRCRWP